MLDGSLLTWLALINESKAKTVNMPVFCAAYGCNNRRSTESRSRGITFHKFPSKPDLRRQWEVGIGRDGFVATESSKLCSEHFKAEDFDRTGQIVRLRDGVTPSIFNFQPHLQRSASKMKRNPSRKAEQSLPLDLSKKAEVSVLSDLSKLFPENNQTSKEAEESQPLDLSMKAEKNPPLDLFQHFSETKAQPNNDHSYALPSSPSLIKARLSDALNRVEILEQEKLNAKVREQRAKKYIESLLEDLKRNNLTNS